MSEMSQASVSKRQRITPASDITQEDLISIKKNRENSAFESAPKDMLNEITSYLVLKDISTLNKVSTYFRSEAKFNSKCTIYLSDIMRMIANSNESVEIFDKIIEKITPNNSIVIDIDEYLKYVKRKIINKIEIETIEKFKAENVGINYYRNGFSDIPATEIDSTSTEEELALGINRMKRMKNLYINGRHIGFNIIHF